MQTYKPKGRGAPSNPAGRFESIAYEADPDWQDEDRVAPQTQLLRDSSQSIISYNDSPDVGFSASINPYRGCEHGCIYCYARPTHEYLGFSAGLDFESRILVKEDAAKLLRQELSSPRWRPQVIVMGGVTDCYQPAEKRLQITRQCLEVMAEFRNPVAIITKSYLVTRDIDVLCELASRHAAAVYVCFDRGVSEANRSNAVVLINTPLLHHSRRPAAAGHGGEDADFHSLLQWGV